MLKIKYIIFAKINVFFPFLFIHGNIIIIGMSLQYLINLKSLFTFFIDNIILGILSVVILKKRKKDKLILIKK